MSKNLIPQIAKMMGVEIGEEFKTVNSDTQYRFSNDSLEFFDRNKKIWCVTGGLALYGLLSGDLEIVKIPFLPSDNQNYYAYARGWDWEVRRFQWKGSHYDYMRKKIGEIFRTEEEAIKERPRIYKELTGKEWPKNKHK